MLSFRLAPQSEFDLTLLQLVKGSQAIKQFSPEGTILEANEAFCSVVGYSLTEIQGQHHRMFCSPEIANSREYRKFWTDLGSGKSSTARFPRITKSGKEIWIQATYGPTFDAKGRIKRIVKIATDIALIRAARNTVLATMQALEHDRLDQEIPSTGVEEFDAIGEAFNASIAKLNTLMAAVYKTTASVETGSAEIRAASEDLALRNELPASRKPPPRRAPPRPLPIN